MSQVTIEGSDKAAAAFRKVYHGNPNFMTPDILEYGLIPGGAYELSKGRGFEGGPIYGVTVVKFGPNGPEKTGSEAVGGPSKCLHSKLQAIKYIETLAETGV